MQLKYAFNFCVAGITNSMFTHVLQHYTTIQQYSRGLFHQPTHTCREFSAPPLQTFLLTCPFAVPPPPPPDMYKIKYMYVQTDRPVKSPLAKYCTGYLIALQDCDNFNSSISFHQVSPVLIDRSLDTIKTIFLWCGSFRLLSRSYFQAFQKTWDGSEKYTVF